MLNIGRDLEPENECMKTEHRTVYLGVMSDWGSVELTQVLTGSKTAQYVKVLGEEHRHPRRW